MMEHSKLLAILQANIENYWKEIDVEEFDQILAVLEQSERITTAQHQTLRGRLELKKHHPQTDE